MRNLILISVFLSVTSMAENEVPDDPYLWLEDVGGEKALEWVEAQNTISVGHLEALASEEDED
jgi:prolyl oligopeptidase